MREPALIRPGGDADAEIFIALIGRCWADYPGCVLDVDAEAPELRALASHYRNRGGALWLAEDGAGMIATAPGDGDAWEICRVYVDPGRHGTGLAARLLAVAEGHACERGAASLFLWTDQRFARAHGFYRKHGYLATGASRALHDIAQTIEDRYAKSVDATARRSDGRSGFRS